MENRQRINQDNFRYAVALCDSCSAVFKLDFYVQVKNLPSSIIGIPDYSISGQCPNCGYPEINTKNSLHNFVEDTFMYLKKLGLPELFILRDALEKFQYSDRTEKDHSEMKDEVLKTAPGLFKIKSFLPTSSSDWAAWISLVITIVFGTISCLQSGNEKPQTVIFNKVENTTIVHPEIVSDSTKVKPGRNDICPCGSGKKFKHCHGTK